MTEIKPDYPCSWAPITDALYRDYHDTEWGVPEYDSRTLWEKLQLDGMQAGLSWITILRKRDNMREEFDGFDPERVARWDQARIDVALTNAGIIRSPAKIKACIGNAQAFLDAADKGEDFSDWLWGYADGKPLVSHYKDYRDSPTKTPISEQLAKDLKTRGHKFCGPVIVYAFMQAVGMINDHEVGCMRHEECQALAR